MPLNLMCYRCKICDHNKPYVGLGGNFSFFAAFKKDFSSSLRKLIINMAQHNGHHYGYWVQNITVPSRQLTSAMPEGKIRTRQILKAPFVGVIKRFESERKKHQILCRL